MLGKKDHDEAVRLFSEAKAIAPASPRPRLGLAAAYSSNGRLPDAIKELEELDPRARTVPVAVALGASYLQANRPADTIRTLTIVAERFRSPRHAISSQPTLDGRPDEAIESSRSSTGSSRTTLRCNSGWPRPRERGAKDAPVRLDPLKTLDKSADYHRSADGPPGRRAGGGGLPGASAAQRLATDCPTRTC
jgi:hypothetical protein